MSNGPDERPEPGATPHDEPQGRTRPDWKHLHLWEMQPVRDILVFAAAFGVLYVGYLISIVTVPLLLALLLAYLFEPIVARLTRAGRMSRSVAAGGLIFLMVFIIVVPVTLGVAFGAVQGVSFVQGVAENTVVLGRSIDARRTDDQRAEARDKLPNDSWRSAADKLTELGVGQSLSRLDKEREKKGERGGANDSPATPPLDDPAEAPDNAQHADSLIGALASQIIDWSEENIGRIGQLAARQGVDLLGAAVRGITTIGVLAFGAFLTAFFFFFISTSYGKVLDFGHQLIPDAHRDRAVYLLREFDRVVAGFIRGRLTIAAIQCVVFSIGYFIIGTPAALLVGIAVGILSIVPYLALIGIPISMTLMWLDPADGFRGAWWWILIAPVAWYFLGQALDDYVLTPKIQGESTGLDTPTVLFASIAGGALAGFYGLLIAIPVAACVKILIREVFWPKFNAWVEGRAKDPLPIGRSASNEESA